MNRLKLGLYVFSVIVLFSLPVATIIVNTDALKDGKEYLFRVEAFDPYDMFRGNYLDINFMEQEVEGVYSKQGNYGDVFFATIDEREDGFAYFSDISLEEPKDISNYYKTRAFYREYSKTYDLETPTRYYMNENKSLDAEKIYEENVDNTYIKVRVKDGKMVIVGVYVDDVLIDSIERTEENT